MEKVIRKNTCFIQRCISTTTINRDSKASKVFGKLLRKSSGTHRRKWYEYTLPSTKQFDMMSHGPSPMVQRRQIVLNKLFMEHVTDIMSSGDVPPELLNRGIETTHVEISTKFSDLHIYWVDKATSTEYTCETQKLLDKYAPFLRHMLIELHVLGTVPRIRFVQNKQYMMLKQLDNILTIADKGPLNKLYVEGPQAKEALSSQLPEMRNDVFGLNHTQIMLQVTNSLNKIRNITQYKPRGNSTFIDNAAVHHGDNKLLVEYLRQNKIKTKKAYKQKMKAMTLETNDDADHDDDDDDDYDDYDDDDDDDNCDTSDDYVDTDDYCSTDGCNKFGDRNDR